MRESEFKGLYVKEFIELPTQIKNESRKLRINTDTSGLEYFDGKKWISNTLVDISFAQGLAELLPVTKNYIKDTQSFDGITDSNDVLKSHTNTWKGRSGIDFNANCSISKLKYMQAISKWKLPSISGIPTKVRNEMSVLKVIIKNTSYATCSFLQQSIDSIVGTHQVRGMFFVRKSNNRTYITDTYRLKTSNSWQHLALKNHKWNPRIVGKGEIEVYIFMPYMSAGWHGPDYLAWNSEHFDLNQQPDNTQLSNKSNKVVITDTFSNVVSSNILVPKRNISEIKDKFLKDIYDHTISTIESYHVDNFIHHDLLMNRFNEAVKFDNDMNIHTETESKYPFMLQYSKEYGGSLPNLANSIKLDVCRYRALSRDMFLEYEKSFSRISSTANMYDLTKEYNRQKLLLTKLGKKIYEQYKN